MKSSIKITHEIKKHSGIILIARSIDKKIKIALNLSAVEAGD